MEVPLRIEKIDLKVLQVTASIAARDGGPSTVVVGINRFLRAHGSDSIILTTDADGPSRRLPVATDRPFLVNESFTWFSPRNRPHSLKNSWALGIRIWQTAKTRDIIHVHGVYLAHSIYAYLASRLLHTPYVLQPHGTLEPYQQAQGKLKKDIYNRLIGHRVVRNAVYLIAASDSERINILTQYPNQRVAVVELPVTDVAPEPVASECLPKDWLRVPKSKRAIFLGRLAQKKRPDLLIEAWNHISDPTAQLLFVGPQQDWTINQLLTLARPDRRETIHFIDSQSDKCVAWCLDQAAIFILPSENENFGIAVAEAMWHECAIITTQETASSKHVISAKAGDVLKAGDVNSLVGSLNLYLSDCELTRKKANSAKRYAREHLTWQRTIFNLLKVYGEAIELNRPFRKRQSKPN